MRKSFKTKLIVLGVLLLSALTFGGCSGCTLNPSLEDVKEEKGLVASITYYANGGRFADSNKEVKTLWYKDGDLPLCIFDEKNAEMEKPSVSANPTAAKVSKDNCILDGWYYAERDEETGELIVDENGEPTASDEAVDFSVRMEEGIEWHIVAKWDLVEVLDVYLVCEEGLQLPSGNNGAGEAQYLTNGDHIAFYPYDNKGTVVNPGAGPLSADGFTFLEFYADEACQTVVSWPVAANGEGDEQTGNKKVYAKYIEGEWTVIKTSKQLQAFFKASVKGNFYLFNDIAYTGNEVEPIETFNGNFQGNGYTITGLKVEFTEIITDTGALGLFGNLTATAKIEDVTLKDTKITYQVKPRSLVDLYFFCTGVASGAVIDGVTIDGGSMSIDQGSDSQITNLQTEIGSEYSAENALFGGYDTDAAFLTAFTGVTVENPVQLIKK